MLRRNVSLCFLFLLFTLLLPPLSARARPQVPPPKWRISTPELPELNPLSDRADTLFLFAAEGPGSPGSPGTYAKGFDFDGEVPASDPAGWFAVDLTAQEGEFWHVASTDICAGTGTDMSQALPFDYPADPTNDYALWCGLEDGCGWGCPAGYGSDWKQYAVVDLSGIPVTIGMAIDFAYRASFEGDIWDWFELQLEVDGEVEVLYHNDIPGDETYRELSFTVLAADYPPGTEFGNLSFYFQSDGAWSDEDGLFCSNVGAVWLDNIIVTVDGLPAFAADFEDGLDPDGLYYDTPPGAGSYAQLRKFLFQEDPCIIDNTNAWAFIAEGHTSPDYPCWVLPYGPPYIEEAIQSPLLTVDASGNPFEFGPDASLWIRYWMYHDQPLSALVFPSNPAVAAWTEEDDCLRQFKSENTVIWLDNRRWHDMLYNGTMDLYESAGGGTVTGLAIRLGVIDMCPYWCDIYGDGSNHGPGPYYDNIQVMLVTGSAVNWNVSSFHRFQDNFPGPAGSVRIDNCDDVAQLGDPQVLPGDSTMLELNMDPLGGIATSPNPDAGEMRPELYLWWRVVAGPNGGMIDEAQADQNASDGIFSPYTGMQLFDGELWGTMQADSAAYQGTVVPGRFAFDFNDDYFQPGDIIEFFYRAEAADGTVSIQPEWAMSADPYLRNYYRVRCLPTEGTTMLLVEDARDVSLPWIEAFRYNGYCSYCEYDVYTTQSPGSGLENGLAGRADPGQLGGYEVIVWDSSNLPAFTICTDEYSKTEDDVLLDDWLRNTEHSVALWVMGDMIANDLTNAEPFLGGDLGVDLLHQTQFYYDFTGIHVPGVVVTHPALEYLGGPPLFWVYGGCPYFRNFSAVAPTGDLCETLCEWQDDGGIGMVAGIFNRDPDGDGTLYNEAGQLSRTVFNPFSYDCVRDAGYGLPAGEDYARLMVGHILIYLFEHLPDALPGDVPGTPTTTRLAGAWPNPFNPSTTLRFSLARREHVRLIVYDVAGRQVRVICDSPLAAGEHELVWDGRDSAASAQASGVYLVSFRAGDRRQEQKLVLLK